MQAKKDEKEIESGVMNVKDLTKYLKLSERKIREMIAASEIPYNKIGKSIRFTKEEIDKWLRKNTVKAG